MTEQEIKNIYDQALERYQAGEEPEKLIPVFKDICQQMPDLPYAWSGLAWLYLLNDQPTQALKAAKRGVKINKGAPQARINLVLAMLALGEKGVRNHIEAAQYIMSQRDELHQEVEENIQDGLTRKPDWKELIKVKKWLF